MKRYSVFYRFKFGNGTCGGREDITAKSFELAVAECRKRHANAQKFVVTRVVDENGKRIVP